MRKPWYGFSEHAPSIGVSWGISLVMLLGGLTASAMPVASPTPSPSPTSIDTEFLLLPSYDLERVYEQGESKTNPVRIGDEIKLRVLGIDPTLGQKSKVEVPPGTSPLNELGWEISEDLSDSLFTVAVIKAGHLTLPTLALNGPDGKYIGRTNPLNLEVVSSIDGKNPLDLVPPVGMAFPRWVIVLAMILLVLSVSGLIFGVLWWMRRKNVIKKIPVPVVPPKPEDEVALTALKELEKQALWMQGRYKQHYFRVSEVLKNYMGARYDCDAPERTASEMIQILQEKRISDRLLTTLATLFDHLDLVKFTDRVPNETESTAIIEDARRIVLTSRRPPPVLKVGPDAI